MIFELEARDMDLFMVGPIIIINDTHTHTVIRHYISK